MTQPLIHHLNLTGVRCAGCVRSLELALAAADEIDDYAINFAERTVAIQSAAPSAQLIGVIEAAGYGAAQVAQGLDAEAQAQASRQQFRQLLRQSGIATGSGVLLMIVGIAGGMPDLATLSGRLIAMLIGVLTLVVMVSCARNIYQGAWQSLQRRSLNMDTLIGLGTGTAWLYSTLLILIAWFSPETAMLAGGHLYYEAAVMILGFILLGQALEFRARGQTADAIRGLLNLQPETAWRERDGVLAEVPVALLVPGDRVVIRAGERVAVDATVISGRSYVDESMLTGEPVPVARTTGDRVTGGTLNGEGSLTVEVVSVGSQTVLAQIIETVRQAQNSKPALGRLADRVAAVFVPVVIGIAVLAALIWLWLGPAPASAYALVVLMTVLIVACPCALGLATPMSVMVGVGRAARSGILIRDGDAFQQAGSVTTVVLDKTGTLTEGHPAVVSEHITAEFDERPELARWIVAAERGSEHPLARALQEHLSDVESVDAEHFQAVPGAGITAVVEGRALLIGNQRWLEQNGVDCSALQQRQQEQSEKGRSLIWVSVDGVLAALYSISDPLRTDARKTVARMVQQGLRVVMLSGDNLRSAAAIARQLGITEFYADVQPAQKQDVIKSLQQQGECVAMVGDGINDAPALVQADTGFAMGKGTDIAIESADVVLMRSEPSLVIEAIGLSRAMVSNIRQNLFGAFIYNSLAIPVAAGVLFPMTGMLLNPVLAGAAMAASSVTVVTNANRLRWVKVDR